MVFSCWNLACLAALFFSTVDCRLSPVAKHVNIDRAEHVDLDRVGGNISSSGSMWKVVQGGVGTGCAHGKPWSFMVREGRSDRLLFEFEGGGCCFSRRTCATPIYRSAIDVNATLKELDRRGGIRSTNNTANPFLDWTHVFLPYCTGDAFMGNNIANYGVHHVGRVNFHFAMEWIATNLHNLSPDLVFVTGESAGSVGSYVLAPWIFMQYPDAKHVQLGDSYAPVFGKVGYNDGVRNWKSVGAYHPSVVEALKKQNVSISEWSPYLAAEATAATAITFPEVIMSSYVSAHDRIESNFYVVEGCGAARCNWEKAMRSSLAIARRAPNFVSFIGPGSRHVVLDSDAMYDVESNSTKLVNWIKEMLESHHAPASVDCDPDCGGDNLSSRMRTLKRNNFLFLR